MNSNEDYRPDIQGLRAIAVLAVIFFHYNSSWLPGGFAGVDVFFVISGYVITKSLTAHIDKHGFRFSPYIKQFYRKRILRIFPALLVVLSATLVAGWFLLMPDEYLRLGASAALSSVGLGNVYFFRHTDYFDPAAEREPLLHMWSLGVEEQFYVVWPVLLFGLLWWSQRRNHRRLNVILALTAIIVLGIAYSAFELTTNSAAAFYLPLPRAWELGVGALLTFLPSVRGRAASEIMGVLGIFLIAWSLLTLKGSA
jgi:peptidoglycan/LPS O-acetylase OafA/YrhL